MNNWIATEGSPFVIVEQQYAHQWNGQEDYNAICSVTDYLGKIYIDNHVCSRLSNGGKTSGE